MSPSSVERTAMDADDTLVQGLRHRDDLFAAMSTDRPMIPVPDSAGPCYIVLEIVRTQRRVRRAALVPRR